MNISTLEVCFGFKWNKFIWKLTVHSNKPPGTNSSSSVPKSSCNTFWLSPGVCNFLILPKEILSHGFSLLNNITIINFITKLTFKCWLLKTATIEYIFTYLPDTRRSSTASSTLCLKVSSLANSNSNCAGDSSSNIPVILLARAYKWWKVRHQLWRTSQFLF